MRQSSIVSVYKLQDEDWNSRIEAGVEGLSRAEWAPDGRTIMCFSDWGLRVTMWSLVTGTATYIQFPKYPDKGWTFRPDGRYFVLAERHKSKDTIGVYDAAHSFKIVRVKHLFCDLRQSAHSSGSTSPSQHPHCLLSRCPPRAPSSPSGKATLRFDRYLAHLILSQPPFQYKLIIVTLAGDQLATFTPAVDPGLGIRTVAWHRTGAYLAVGGWDEKVCLTCSQVRPLTLL